MHSETWGVRTNIYPAEKVVFPCSTFVSETFLQQHMAFHFIKYISYAMSHKVQQNAKLALLNELTPLSIACAPVDISLCVIKVLLAHFRYHGSSNYDRTPCRLFINCTASTNQLSHMFNQSLVLTGLWVKQPAYNFVIKLCQVKSHNDSYCFMYYWYSRVANMTVNPLLWSKKAGISLLQPMGNWELWCSGRHIGCCYSRHLPPFQFLHALYGAASEIFWNEPKDLALQKEWMNPITTQWLCLISSH